MKKVLDQVSHNQFEDICLTLWDVHPAPHVELRVYRRAPRPGADTLPRTEGISVPVDALPDLLRMLEQTQERLIRQGLVHLPSSAAGATTMEGGEMVPLGISVPSSHRGDCRRESRTTLEVPAGCRLLGDAGPCGSEPLIGEIRDVSRGGAQIWLPRRLPLFSRAEVFMRIGELNFQGRAEVVGAEVHPKNGRYRHGLRWLLLNAESKTALSKVISPV